MYHKYFTVDSLVSDLAELSSQEAILFCHKTAFELAPDYAIKRTCLKIHTSKYYSFKKHSTFSLSILYNFTTRAATGHINLFSVCPTRGKETKNESTSQTLNTFIFSDRHEFTFLRRILYGIISRFMVLFSVDSLNPVNLTYQFLNFIYNRSDATFLQQ